MPGADVNPYIAYAAAIAAGLDGIEQPDRAAGDVRRRRLLGARGSLGCRHSLAEAVGRFEPGVRWPARPSATDVVDHYVHFFNTEVAAHRRAVTDWERIRYFERI